MKVSEEELLNLVSRLSEDWVVSSTPFGCPEGYSKVYLRRRKTKKAWSSVRVNLPMSRCLPDEKAKDLKRKIRAKLK